MHRKGFAIILLTICFGLTLSAQTSHSLFINEPLFYENGNEVSSVLLTGPRAIDNRVDMLEPVHINLADSLIVYARSFLGKRYRTKHNGQTLDCSGYCQMLFRYIGFDIPRTATEQYAYAHHVPRAEIVPGDIVVFRNRKNTRIGHVGIVTQINEKGNFRFIHSSTSAGIIEEWFDGYEYYTRRLVGFARII